MSISITKDSIEKCMIQIQQLFIEDEIPWVVGYSGGKDSTATLQLVWYAIKSLPIEQRKRKTIHVISTDTLVEQPIVCAWVNESLELMKKAALEQDMPIIPHRLTPKIQDSFWVNLIGKGYPAPRQGFRWCTSRLKINPSNNFILEMVKTHGETIMVLGTRKAESASRAATMKKYEKARIRQWLSPNGSLPNSWVFSPIEEWSNDDVWFYLTRYQNPWNRSNKDLLAMYRGASPDNECPLVIDSSTPSCGNSRFGCWVCTLVTSDKSMEAMIQNDVEKIWLSPLLEFRNEIANINENSRINDWDRRDFRRLDGKIKLKDDESTIHGPYIKTWREYMIRRLLSIQKELNEQAPPEIHINSLITDDELREIRRIWVMEKHEFNDALPQIYNEVMGKKYPYIDDIESGPFGQEEWNVLSELCDNNYVSLELQASLLDIEQHSNNNLRRKSILDELESAIKRCYYQNENDAIQFTRQLNEETAVLPNPTEEGFEIE